MAVIVTAAKTTYARNGTGNLWLRNTSQTPPATLYLALYSTDPGPDMTGGTEVSGNAYAREAITFYAPTTVNAGTTLEAQQWLSQGTINFPTATPSAWPAFSGFALMDAAVGGHGIYHGAWNQTQNVGAGSAFQVADQAIAVQEV